MRDDSSRTIWARSVIAFILVFLVWLLGFLPYRCGWVQGKAHELGDSFGIINALFSGFAFAGVIVAILLQWNELKLQYEEIRDTRLAMERQVELNAKTTQIDLILRLASEIEQAKSLRSAVVKANKHRANELRSVVMSNAVVTYSSTRDGKERIFHQIVDELKMALGFVSDDERVIEIYTSLMNLLCGVEVRLHCWNLHLHGVDACKPRIGRIIGSTSLTMSQLTESYMSVHEEDIGTFEDFRQAARMLLEDLIVAVCEEINELPETLV